MYTSLLSGYPEPAATHKRIRGLRPARDGYKLQRVGWIVAVVNEDEELVLWYGVIGLVIGCFSVADEETADGPTDTLYA